MKKRIAVIAATFAVLLAAFLVYDLTSRKGLPENWRAGGRANAAGAVSAIPGQPFGAGPTDNPLAKQYDKFNNLQAVYRGKVLKRTGDLIYVDRPSMEWYLKGGEIITAQGKTGVIKAGQIAEKWRIYEGDLMDEVVVALDRSRSPVRAPLAERPDEGVRIYLDSVHFDNELLTIQSDSRVRLFSKEADVLGKGLRMEWSEGPRELRQLRIDQGDFMDIREGADRFREMALPGGEGTTTAPAGASEERAARADAAGAAREPGGRALPPPARTDAPGPDPATPAIAPPGRGGSRSAANSRPATVKDTYVATLSGDVKVTSGGRLLKNADQLRLVFDYKPRRPRTELPPGAEPVGKGPPKPADSKPPAKPADPKDPAKSAGTAGPTNPPTTQPGEPVRVTWTGPLVITPLRGEGQRDPRQFDVAAHGQKLELADVKARALCQRFDFTSPTQVGKLVGSPDDPVQLWLANGEKITVGQVRFDRSAGQVYLDGPGNMLLTNQSAGAVGPSAGKDSQKQEVYIEWSRDVQALIGQRAVRSAGGQQDRRDFLRQAAFAGDVLARQGRAMSMRADDMVAYFAPPAGAEDPANRIERLTAAGNVRLADDEAHQYSDSKTLDVRMAVDRETGRLFPQLVTAEGDVRAQQEKAEIKSDKLVVVVAMQLDEQTRQKKPQPRQLDATGHVSVVDKTDEANPVTVQADSAVAFPAQKTVSLKGSPAVVTQKDSVIRGEDVFMDQLNQRANVAGKGGLRFLTDSDISGNRQAQPRLVDVAWTRSMDYHGPLTADFVGDVVLATGGDRLTGRTMHVLFNPPAEPASAPGAGAAAKAGRFGGARSFRPGKPSQVIVDKNVELTSELKDEGGYLLRRMWLKTEQLLYYFEQNPVRAGAATQSAQSQKLRCPAAGMASFEDYRLPPKEEADKAKPAPGAAKDKPAEIGPGGRKLTTPSQFAFEWHKAMEMDQRERVVRALGNVHVAMREGNQVVRLENLKVRPWDKLPAGRISDLRCERLLAVFDEAEKPAPPAAEAAASAVEMGPRLGALKMFDAFGDDKAPDDLVKLTDDIYEFHCRRAQYERKKADKQDTEIVVIWGSMPGEPPRDAIMFRQEPGKPPQSTKSPVFTYYRDRLTGVSRVEMKNVEGRGAR